VSETSIKVMQHSGLKKEWPPLAMERKELGAWLKERI
jgi:hypothetical protein